MQPKVLLICPAAELALCEAFIAEVRANPDRQIIPVPEGLSMEIAGGAVRYVVACWEIEAEAAHEAMFPSFSKGVPRDAN